MGVLTGTPCATIEQGKKEYDETALRQGVRNWIEKYGKYRPLTISLGNEPHGTGERVRANVAAYRVVYEEIKKIDPSIFVVATAVEPNKEYFKFDYGKYCDAYDFHIYEGFENVRKAIGAISRADEEVRQSVKPIWSTELGLNSQGMPRHAVAVELIKTFTTFFAAGGVQCVVVRICSTRTATPNRSAVPATRTTSSTAATTATAPRLDAVAYYNAVNAIAIKKFARGETICRRRPRLPVPRPRRPQPASPLEEQGPAGRVRAVAGRRSQCKSSASTAAGGCSTPTARASR